MGGGEVAIYTTKDGLGVEWVGSEVMFEASFTLLCEMCLRCHDICVLFSLNLYSIPIPVTFFFPS